MPNDIRITTLGTRQTEGARLLWQALPRFGGQNGLARALGAASSLVNRWLHCQCTPKTRWAIKLQAVAGIEMGMWARAPRRPIKLLVSHG